MKLVQRRGAKLVAAGSCQVDDFEQVERACKLTVEKAEGLRC